MYVAFIFSNTNWEGKLCNLFTGCYCYHVGFVTDDKKWMYELNILRRRVSWEGRYPEENVMLVPCPVKEEWLLDDIANYNGHIFDPGSWYGLANYLMFAVRPIYRVLGKQPKNFKGEICSQWVNEALIAAGVNTGFDKNAAPPSPCDLLKFYTPSCSLPEASQSSLK